jgi:hypothetical protein
MSGRAFIIRQAALYRAGSKYDGIAYIFAMPDE